MNNEMKLTGNKVKNYFNRKLDKIKAVKGNLTSLNEDVKKLGFLGVLKAIWMDLFGGRSLKGWIYLILLAGVQIGAYILNPESFLGMVAGLTGILCVIYVNEQRASNYLFGLVNSLIYLYMSMGSSFYGEVATTLFFTVMQPIGLYMWLVNAKQPKADNVRITVKKLDFKGWVKNLFITAVVWLGMGFLYSKINSARPFRDSVTDGTNVTGQFLMNGGFAEQWIFWAATNVFSIYLWWGESFELTVMYWVYLLNSIVGWVNWTIDAKELRGLPVKDQIKGLLPFQVN